MTPLARFCRGSGRKPGLSACDAQVDRCYLSVNLASWLGNQRQGDLRPQMARPEHRHLRALPYQRSVLRSGHKGLKPAPVSPGPVPWYSSGFAKHAFPPVCGEGAQGRRKVCPGGLAETEGFEPSVPDLPVRRFSKPLVSATHPRLRIAAAKRGL